MAKQLTWSTVEIDTLPKKVQDAWATYRKASEDARTTFENTFHRALEDAKAIPTGKKPVFGYKWGKLSVAFDDATAGTTGETFKFPGKA
jgi:hypothetical protein